MLLTTAALGIICLIYAFTVDIMSDITKPTPTRAAVVLGIGIALVLTGIGAAHAAEWTSSDTKREFAFQGLWAIDALQTRNIAAHPDKWREQNNYLGAHPTIGAVDRYFIAGSVLHAGVSYLLPEKYRAPFQYVTIGIETGYVANNLSLGIGAKF